MRIQFVCMFVSIYTMVHCTYPVNQSIQQLACKCGKFHNGTLISLPKCCIHAQLALLVHNAAVPETKSKRV